MALTVQNSDGSVSGANAYVTLAEFKSYHGDRGNDYSAFSDPQINSAIIRATDFIDTRFAFRGVKQTFGVKATGTLTGTGNFSLNDSVTIGSKTYTFKAAASQPYQVVLGGDLATSLDKLTKALSGTGTPGVDYGVGTEAHGDVTSAHDATTLTVTAVTGGADGNAIPTTETSTAASWGGTTLDGGGAQTTEFPRKAGTESFVPFIEPFSIPLVLDGSLNTFTLLVGPDGLQIIGIPVALKRACNEYSFRALVQPLLQDAPAPEGGGLISKHSVQVETIQETFEYQQVQSGGFVLSVYPAADLLLERAGLIESGRVLTR